MNNIPTPPDGETSKAASGSRVYRILKRTILVAFILFFLLLAAGYFYETSQLNRIANELKPPGELVDINGRALHIRIQGEGSPTVVLEAGLGGGVLDWTLVAPEIAKFTRVVSYDRAGLGWSEAAATPRTPRLVVEDLRTALKSKQVDGPFVLVGHSDGGLKVRMFYYMHPEDVAALVLVDSSHVDQDPRLPKELAAKFAEIEQITSVSSKLSAFGITRLLMKLQGGGSVFPELELLPESAQSAWMDMAACRSQLLTVIQELNAWEESCLQLKEAEIPYGDLPVSVLTAGKAPFDLGESYSNAWLELQAELAGGAFASHRVIEDSGHYIHIQQPETVIEEVRRIIQKLRTPNQ